MTHDWQELTRISRGDDMLIEQVRLVKKNISVSGQFELPPLSRLSEEDQIFIIAFIRCHGSIKVMESQFGISYPTVKNRLNKIAQSLDFVEVDPPTSKSEVLSQLEKGEISVEEAEQILKGEK